jgi:branched-subunit amino acid ABC-type transport system permease component
MDRRQLREMERRNERQMRIVQAIVGTVCGAGAGFVIVIQISRFWYTSHSLGWPLLIVVLISAVLGGLAGYYGNTWQGAVDR